MTTTTPAKPRRRRAKRAVRKPATVTMNQQQPPLQVEVPTTTRVDRIKPDVQLITRQQYWSDIQARMKIHNYEFAEAMDDLKIAASWTNEQIKKLIKRIESVELK